MTGQAADSIVIDGFSHTMLTFPLEIYRAEHRPDMVFFQASPNTACWRGYQAEWKIDDGKLFLLNVDGYVSYKGRNPNIEAKEDIRWGRLHPGLFQEKVPATLFELFGSEADRVPATWFSGELRLASYWDDPNYQTIAVTDGICGELINVGVIDTSLDDAMPF
jgi:hypothetical protein